MKPKAFAVVTILALALVGQAAEIRWVKTYTEAKKLAARSGKLIMVDFYTDWCGWCKKLDKDTYTDSKVVQLSSQVVAIKLDAEKDGKEQAKKYAVNGYPTIMFLTSTGEVAGKIVGYMPPAGFAGELTKIVQAHKEFPGLQRELKAKPNDGRLNARMAVALCSRGQADGAIACLKKSESAQYAGPEMARAYNAVGDTFQNEDKLDEAILYFEKAEKLALDPSTKGYAMISRMYCYLGKGDQATAKKIAQQILAVPGVEAEYVKMAEDLLKSKE